MLKQNAEMSSCLQLSKSPFGPKILPCRVACNSDVISFKQNVEMSSCLQLNMSSFSNKMLRYRFHSKSASRHVETKCWDTYLHVTQQVVVSIQDVEIQSRENTLLSPDIQILSPWNSGSRYLEWPFYIMLPYFCHQIFRYWVLGTREVVILNGPSILCFRIFVTRYSDTKFLELGKSLSWIALLYNASVFLSPDIQILSSWNSGSRYLEWPYYTMLPYFCHQIFRYWVSGFHSFILEWLCKQMKTHISCFMEWFYQNSLGSFGE